MNCSATCYCQHSCSCAYKNKNVINFSRIYPLLLIKTNALLLHSVLHERRTIYSLRDVERCLCIFSNLNLFALSVEARSSAVQSARLSAYR